MFGLDWHRLAQERLPSTCSSFSIPEQDVATNPIQATLLHFFLDSHHTYTITWLCAGGNSSKCIISPALALSSLSFGRNARPFLLPAFPSFQCFIAFQKCSVAFKNV